MLRTCDSMVRGVSASRSAIAWLGAYAAADGNLVDLLLGRRCPTDTSHLVVGGALLLPVWLLWTGRLLRADHRSRHAP